jgi:DNA-directed RNA polymerase subunit H (RpoH/RPB5)
MAETTPTPTPDGELGGSSGREILRSFVTIREMLVDRGLDTSSLDGQPLAELLARAGAERSDVFFVDVASCRVRVVYDMHPKLKMADIKKQLDSAAHDTFIVVAREKHPLSKSVAFAASAPPVTPPPPLPLPPVAEAADEAAAAAAPGGTSEGGGGGGGASEGGAGRRAQQQQQQQQSGAREVQVFEFAELQYNPSRHMLVPSHEPIREEPEIETILRRYRLKTRYQLPLILSTDPMARYLALKPGQLVRIVRQSPSAGTYVLYRCCQRA